MPIAIDTFNDQPTERKPGEFQRSSRTGAPIVAHPTETTKHDGKKADLIALCAQRGIALPDKVTVAQLHDLLGGRPRRVTYGRPSSLGKQIENMSNIQKWSERAVALGLYLNDDGFDELAEMGILDPSKLNLDDPKARELLDKIAVRAKATAQAGLAADRGTHTHELTEDHDSEVDWIERARSGEDLGLPHAVQEALVAAWAKMLEQFDIEILATEAKCVDDTWRQAGTLDRICRLRRQLTFVTVTGELVTLPAGWTGILDIKTGRLRLDDAGFVSYWHSYAVQLASYAQSKPYDPDTDVRGEWGFGIDQRYAVIAHLDVLAALDGEAVCRLVLVDLEAGRHAGALCVAAREWEKRTDVFSIPTDDLAVRVAVDQIAAGGGADDPAVPVASPVAPAAPIAPPESPLSPAPVAEPSPLRQAQLERAASVALAEAKRRLYATPGEGDMSDERTFIVLQKRFERLTDARKSWIRHLADEADKAKVGFSAKGHRSQRRFEILRALVILAERDESDEHVREWLSLVDERIAQLGTVPLGHIVGSLTTTEAAQFARLVDAERITVSDDGRVEVAA